MGRRLEAMRCWIYWMIFVALLHSGTSSGVKVELCSKDQKLPLLVERLRVSPNPIRFPGSLTVDLVAKSTAIVKGPVDVKVSMYKKTFFGYIYVPFCIKHVGSCDYKKLCAKLDGIVQKKGCNIGVLAAYGISFLPKLDKCTCPISATTVTIDYKNLTLPELSSVYSFFANGSYKVIGKVYDQDKLIGCFRAYVGIDS